MKPHCRRTRGRSLLPSRKESKTVTLFWLGGGFRPLAWQKRSHLATAHAWIARRPSAGQERGRTRSRPSDFGRFAQRTRLSWRKSLGLRAIVACPIARTALPSARDRKIPVRGGPPLLC